MTTRIHTISLLAALLSAAVPALALAAESTTRTKTESLACGNSALTVQTTSFINKDWFGQVLSQRMTLKNKKTNQLKELPTDGRRIIRPIDGHKILVLDAAIEGVGCIKANNGKYYFETLYSCTEIGDDEWKGICTPKRASVGPYGTVRQVEWDRYLREDGTLLYKSPRHWRLKRDEEALYTRLGLYDRERMIRWKDIDD